MYALREALNIVFRSQPCHLKETIIIHNVYFFKVRANDIFCFKSLTNEDITERKTQEREREREREREFEREREAVTPCIQFFICLCSSVSSYNLK